MLDGVGILTDRAVLIAQFTVEQNIAMPFTLEIDPMAADVRPRVVALAGEVGLERRGSDDAHRRARRPRSSGARAARARPRARTALLLAEHPSATLPREAVKAFAATSSGRPRARGSPCCRDHRRSGLRRTRSAATC